MAPREKLPDLELLPETLRKALVKMMAAENLDYAQALDRAGLLLDTNSEAYKKAVEAGGNTRYKSRFLRELNMARGQWKASHDKALLDKRLEGWIAGRRSVFDDEMVWRVPCSVCGEPMRFSSKDKGFAEEYEVLKAAFSNWHHSTCPTDEE
jgi:hypothetical protein